MLPDSKKNLRYFNLNSANVMARFRHDFFAAQIISNSGNFSSWVVKSVS